jgi:hypothetical protein
MTARETLGVTLDPSLTSGNGERSGLVEQALAAGAGWIRTPGELAFVAKEEPAPPLQELSLGELADSAALANALSRVAPAQALLACGTLSGLRNEPSLPAPPRLDEARHAAIAGLGIGIEGMSGDAQPLEAALRAWSSRFREQGFAQPIWITDLVVPPEPAAEEQAAAIVKLAAHALALGVVRVFLRLGEENPRPALFALGLLAAWMDGARRVTWIARGQYRAEFADRQSRFLLWADPKNERLPSSLQGPLHARDLTGAERRVETSSLRLAESPILVERKEGMR